MKEIKLTQNKNALVDDEDFEYLSQFKWCATKGWNTFYAVRTSRIKGTPKYKMVYMHRELLNHPSQKVDHIDHNGLNNQRNNLRKATDAQNSANTTSRINSSSPYVGVYARPTKKKKWAACIRKNGITKYIGSFDNPIEAALAYNKKAIEMFGEFANLNKVAS